MQENAPSSNTLSGNVHEIGLSSLMYVSRSSLSLGGDAAAVDEIVRCAVSRNAELQVTGALIYTELHFAQVLEGPALALRALMNSILKDKRHHDVTIVSRQRSAVRRFEAWAMAYDGPSAYLDRYVKPLIGTSESTPNQAEKAAQLFAKIQHLYGLSQNG